MDHQQLDRGPFLEAQELRTMLRGARGSRRKQECEEHLLRYVRTHKRKRGHSESEQRAWLQARCPLPTEASVA